MIQAGTEAAVRTALRIAVACGGTGGHVFPGLATARALRARGHEVTLWLAGRDEERAALEGCDFRVMIARSKGFIPSLALPGILAPFRIAAACVRCASAMRSAKPDAMLAMGSHASVAPALGAKLLGVPLVLHEANVIPGRAIKFLAPFARAIAIGFDETRLNLRHGNMTMIGMPLRRPCETADARALFAGLGDGGFVILAMGGSRGAHVLNMMVSAAIIRLRRAGRDIRVIHLAGAADEESVRRLYLENNVPCAVFGFLEAADAAYGRSDFAVCRAGASTCAELAHYALPALLVPYPLATHQHQLANARPVEKAGAANLVEEKDLSEERLADYLAGLIEDAPRLELMKVAARSRAVDNAAAALADLVEQSAR